MHTMMDLISRLPLLQAAGGGSQLVTMLITFGLIIVIFYFLIIRPQRKKQKDTQDMLSNLHKGDRVSTVGGIRGVVTAVKDSTVTIKVDDNTKIEFNKSAVSAVLERKESKEGATETQE
jgi:preprotein translocase subunit YajC